MRDFMISLLSGAQGEISSKRVSALLLIFSGIVYSFTLRDPAMCAILIGGGCALLGVSAFTKS